MEDPGSFRSGSLDWDQGSRIRLIEEQRQPAREGSGAGGGVNSKGHRALLLSKTKLDPWRQTFPQIKNLFSSVFGHFQVGLGQKWFSTSFFNSFNSADEIFNSAKLRNC